MKLLLTLITFINIQLSGLCAQTLNTAEKGVITEGSNQLIFAKKSVLPEGSYQFLLQNRNTELNYELTETDKEYLESMRANDEMVIVLLNKDIRIRLASKNQMESGDFKKMERISYLNEEINNTTDTKQNFKNLNH